MLRGLAFFAALCVIGWCGSAYAAEQDFQLEAPPVLHESGLLAYLVPRFSLKTGVRIELAEGGAVLGQDGVPVFAGAGQVWSLQTGNLAGAERFLDWLSSDIGKRSIAAFPQGGFSAEFDDVAVVEAVAVEGDAVRGSDLSLQLCGRCHVIDARNRMNGLGSTPSFAVLRTFDDWQGRFEQFYVLAPHRAFTQIAGVTGPFDPEVPSPIVPMELSLEDLEAITAFAAEITPADLGAPVQSR